MPELSRFYGIVIRMYYDDHNPPHFHARYGSDEMLVGIDPLGILAGRIPSRATGLVLEWAAQHQDDLRRAWAQAEQLQSIDRIDPLP